MKSLKKILPLALLAIAIVTLWLKPNLNRASDKRYTRVYEDTGIKIITRDTVKTKKARLVATAKKENKKKYKTETIDIEDYTKIKPSMFTRSIQFFPEVYDSTALEEIQTDTTTAYTKN